MYSYRPNYQVIDKDLTETIRTTLAEGRNYVGPLYTEAEIDFLLDGADDMNENFATDITEEVIFRAHGIRLDMAVEGPSSKNVGRVPEASPHGSYLVMQADVKARTYKLDAEDAHLVPLVTPEDANFGSNSIDFASMRARGLPLEGIKIDVKASPIETALLNSLATIQTLNHFGVQVDELVNALDIIWGIDYTAELIAKVSLANAKDLSKYIAIGGRPSPSIYLSPNVLSQYQLIARPTISNEALGSSNIYFARSAALSKFIPAMTNMFMGTIRLKSAEFTMNPSQVSVFDPGVLKGKVLTSDVVPVMTKYRNMAGKIDTFDDFIAARQSAKVALRDSSWAIATDLDAITKLAMPNAMMSFESTFATKGASMMDLGTEETIRRMATIETAAPSRVSSILFGRFHNAVDVSMYQAITETSVVLLLIHTGFDHPREMAPHWAEFAHVNGFADVLLSINASRMAEFPEIKRLMETSADPIRVMKLYAVSRHMTHVKIQMRDAFDMVQNWLATGIMPDLKVRTREKQWAIINTRYERTLKMVIRVLAKNSKIVPYKYISRIDTEMIRIMGKSCLLLTPLAAIAKASTMQDSWIRHVGDKKADVATDNAMRVRPLFAHLRVSWSGFYMNKYKSYCNMIRIGIKAKKLSGITMAAIMQKGIKWWTHQEIVLNGLVIEAYVALAKALAYQFMQVKYVYLKNTGTEANILEATVNQYRHLLSTMALSEARKGVDLNPKMGQFDANSHLRKAMDTHLAEYLNKYANATLPETEQLAIIKSVYYTNRFEVATCIADAVENDWHIVHAEVIAPPDLLSPAIIMPDEPPPVIDFEEMFAAMPDLVRTEDDILAKGLAAEIRMASEYVEDLDPALARQLVMIADSPNFTIDRWEMAGRAAVAVRAFIGTVEEVPANRVQYMLTDELRAAIDVVARYTTTASMAARGMMG